MSYPATPGAGLTFAADQDGTPSAPAAGQLIPYVKLDSGVAGGSSPVTPTSPLPAQGGGGTAVSVPNNATTTVKTGTGRICRVLVTTAGTGSGDVLIYDNVAGSGLVVGVIPATIAVGTYYTFDMPLATGLTIVSPANGPVLTVSYY